MFTFYVMIDSDAVRDNVSSIFVHIDVNLLGYYN